MSLAVDRVLVVPRWAGSPTSDYYPWMLDALGNRFGASLEVRVLAMPDEKTPRVDAWPPVIADELGTDRAVMKRTLLVGHSVGCQAILRALALMPEGAEVHGALLVAPWFRVDEPWETLLPWMVEDYDVAKARARLGWLDALLSDNDPFTADYRRTATELEERAGAVTKVIEGAAHFNGAEEPSVLAALVSRISGR